MALTPPHTTPTTSRSSTSETRLGCGRDLDEIWDRINDAPDAHELTCSYCQAARADLAGLAQASAAMRDDDITNADRQPGPQVLERILSVARAEVRRGRRLPLDLPRADGTSPNTVSEQAVNAVVWRVGDRTAHLQVRRCTIKTLDTSGATEPAQTVVAATGTVSREDVPGATSPPGAARVAVSVRVSVAHDLSIAQVTQQLRDGVVDAVEREVGLEVTRVDISVEDLHDA